MVLPLNDIIIHIKRTCGLWIYHQFLVDVRVNNCNSRDKIQVNAN